jgi:hypothetical protein
MDSESPLNWNNILNTNLSKLISSPDDLLDSEQYNSFNFTYILICLIFLLCFFFCLLIYQNNKIIFNRKSKYTPTELDDDHTMWC